MADEPYIYYNLITPISVLEIGKISKLSVFQMQDNLTPGSCCPDDCMVALKILYNLLLT